MALFAPTRVRRGMTTIARARRQIQQLGPYQSLAALMVPMALVEPIKIVALFVAGTGHWFSGTVMMVATYAASILLIERLFKVVKPKLMMLSWFAISWTWIIALPSKILTKVR